MVQLDFSSETLASCTAQILKHSNWKEETKYYHQHLFPLGQSVIGKSNIPVTVCRIKNEDSVNYYVKQEVFGVQWVPEFMAQSLLGKNSFTFWIGPYAFVNGFEETVQGKYLIKMLEYPSLTERAQQKVNDILNIYCYWVQVDKQFMEILKQRDSNKGARIGSIN